MIELCLEKRIDTMGKRNLYLCLGINSQSLLPSASPKLGGIRRNTITAEDENKAMPTYYMGMDHL